MTQDPSTDVLPQKIRQQFSTRILLGSANSDIQRMALEKVATSRNVEDFRGFYVSDGLTIQPMKFFVQTCIQIISMNWIVFQGL